MLRGGDADRARGAGGARVKRSSTHEGARAEKRASAADWKAAAEAERRMRWKLEDDVAQAVRRLDAGEVDGAREDLRELVTYLFERREKLKQGTLAFGAPPS